MKKNATHHTPKKATKVQKRSALLIGGVAMVLVGGSFALAAGTGFDSGSLVASVMAAFSGQPTILVTPSLTSPSGGIVSAVNQNLATFNVVGKNIVKQGSVQTITLHIPVTGPNPSSSFVIGNMSAHYTYCIPQGSTYGYGYTSAGCATSYLRLASSSPVDSMGAYTVTFAADGKMPVYPQQTYAALIISGTPAFVARGKSDADFRIEVAGGTALADLCSIAKGCNHPSATVTSAMGRSLHVKRPYGYGYLRPKPAPSPTPTTTPLR
jgi:hypothetical protein